MSTAKHNDIAGIIIPPGARAVLVFEDGVTPGLKIQPVAHDASVLNIERDLLKHLNDAPRSTEWLQLLWAYCDQRLAVREKAVRSLQVVEVPSQAVAMG